MYVTDEGKEKKDTGTETQQGERYSRWIHKTWCETIRKRKTAKSYGLTETRQRREGRRGRVPPTERTETAVTLTMSERDRGKNREKKRKGALHPVSDAMTDGYYCIKKELNKYTIYISVAFTCTREL